MLNFLKKLPIRRQLKILSICTGIIVLSIIFMVYSQMANILTIKNEQYTSEMFQQIKNGISTNCSFMEKMLLSTSYNNIVQGYILEKDEIKRNELFKNMNNLFANMQEIREGIKDFVIIGSGGNEYFLNGRKPVIREIIKKIPDRAINYYTESVSLTYNDFDGKYFLITSTIYSIYDLHEYGEIIGTGAIIVEPQALGLESSKKLKESETKFYLLDRAGNIYSSNDSLINDDTELLIKNIAFNIHGQSTIEYNNEKYIVNLEQLPKIDGKIISIVSEDILFSELNYIRKITFIMLFATLLLLSLYYIVVSNNILQPLYKLIGFMNNLKSGDMRVLKNRIDLIGYSEIEIMARAFNGMLDEVDNLTHRLINSSTRLYEMELEKKKAELGYLKSQINPHFLYNTLEAIKGKAVEEDAPKVLEMTKSLGVIFRNSIKGADMVELNEELNIVRPYIYIQQIRFGNRFDIEYNFSEEAFKCKVPKMILQPIVENAIYHGLESKLGNGHLSVGGEVYESGDLYIWVEDNGVGIDEETLIFIRRSLNVDVGKEDISNSSIGIRNVNNRLKLMYGENYGIEIDSELECGTKVLLKIPSRRYEDV